MNNKRQIVKRKVESATEDVGRDLWKTRKSVARSQTKKKKKFLLEEVDWIIIIIYLVTREGN